MDEHIFVLNGRGRSVLPCCNIRAGAGRRNIPLVDRVFAAELYICKITPLKAIVNLNLIMTMHKINLYPLRITPALMTVFLLSGIALSSCDTRQSALRNRQKQVIQEVNASEIPVGNKPIAIIGALVVDGNGGAPLENGCVIISDGKISAMGITGEIKIPDGAEVVDAQGMTLLPGFIDAHFHLDRVKDLPAKFLQHGVTSLRDPGAWIEAYDEERRSGRQMPRLFLSGPHLDMFPPAYPNDAYIVRDATEASRQVHRMIDSGATVIKIYFRLPPDIIRAICEAAHSRGIPVTGHLETTEAMEAIEAGLDGIEHITSFGLSLIPQREGEKYRRAVLADNNARKQGRYEVWKSVDPDGPMADSLARFLVKKGTFVTPTLGPFEYRLPQPIKNGDTAALHQFESDKQEPDSARWMGFNRMKALTAKLRKSGVAIVVGSHSMIPYAEEGWAYQRELELLVESGLSNAEAIVAATMENARFFGVADKLGSINEGKIADLVLLKGNPLINISDARNIERVMLNGAWVPADPR